MVNVDKQKYYSKALVAGLPIRNDAGGALTGSSDGYATQLQTNSSGELLTSASINGDINVDSTSVDTSGLVGKSSGGDFTTAYASGTTIDCTNLPAFHSTLLDDDIVSIVQIATGGTVTNTYSRDDAGMSVTTNTITVTGATFAASDSFVIYTNVFNEDNASAGGAAIPEGVILVGKEAGTYTFDASAQTVTLAGLGTVNLEDVVKITNVTDQVTIYDPENQGKGGTISSNVITLEHDTTSMADTDALQVYVKYSIGKDAGLDVIKGIEQAPLNRQAFAQSLADTTNVSAATHYYPSATGTSMDGYKDLSFSGKLIDADETLTLTIEAMNDDDTTSGDWNQVYAYDDKNNTTTNSRTVTNGTLTFAISLNEMNYKHYRVKLVAGGATNTVIIKQRKKAL